MKHLALIFMLFVTSATSAQMGEDAEIICNGFQFREVAGIMSITGDVKNNTPYPMKEFKVRIQFLRGAKVVDSVLIRTEGLAPGEQRKISTRMESVSERWFDYKMSFLNGTSPLLWRRSKVR